MPVRPTKNKAQLATQLDAELLERFRAYVAHRGETLTFALERALAREMAYPPPPPAPPPPLEPLPDAEAGTTRPKKSKGK